MESIIPSIITQHLLSQPTICHLAESYFSPPKQGFSTVDSGTGATLSRKQTKASLHSSSGQCAPKKKAAVSKPTSSAITPNSKPNHFTFAAKYAPSPLVVSS